MVDGVVERECYYSRNVEAKRRVRARPRATNASNGIPLCRVIGVKAGSTGLRPARDAPDERMDTLSRREEETLAKTTKEQALKECDPVVKGTSLNTAHVVLCADSMLLAFADCATGRTVSVAWACRDKYKAVQECMVM